MAQPASKEILRYGNKHVLQTVSVTVLSNDHSSGYWVIYIHGGAWRDPTKTSAGFDLTQSILLSHPQYLSHVIPHVAGFASIEYRLSAHPDHPQNASMTDPTEYRNAKHPDHIQDVEAALALLQTKYAFGERYVLVGHSCGATLAFQSVMDSLSSTDQPGAIGINPAVPAAARAKPTAILGVAGIYDCRLLRDRFYEIGAYQLFLEGAFGADERGWNAVSPAKVQGEHGVKGGWAEAGKLAVLAYSPDDELVDPSQVDAMKKTMELWEKDGGRRLVVLSLNGTHDEIWMKGDELARAIAFTFGQMQVMGLLSGA